MHEMGIVYGMFDTLRDIIKQNNITSPLLSVTLEVGEASMVVSSYLQECFDIAKEDTEFKNTKLIQKEVPCIGRCSKCGHEFKVKENDRVCPICHSENDFTPVDGTEINISEVDFEQSQDELNLILFFLPKKLEN